MDAEGLQLVDALINQLTSRRQEQYPLLLVRRRTFHELRRDNGLAATRREMKHEMSLSFSPAVHQRGNGLLLVIPQFVGHLEILS
jgi:hypothetical protein